MKQVGKLDTTMPRYVILEHDHPTLHWDFMLELGDVLRAWRLPTPPADGALTAQALGDHRRLYLDYEGLVGGQRGTVKRWDAGAYETLAAETVEDWTIALRGARWSGTATLIHAGGSVWSITFAPAAEGPK